MFKVCLKAKIRNSDYGFMRSENASPLLYTYSYGKFGQEVREVFTNASLA
jgi:hypothetical protein